MMKRELVLLCVSVAATSAVGFSAPADPGPAFTDPAEAGPDFLVQGEYVGQLRIDGKMANYGIQVVALGDGKFRASGYLGGLPADGWDGKDRVQADGQTVDAETVFVTDVGAKGVIVDGVMTVTDANGRKLGSLKRIVRKSPTLGARPPQGAVVLFDGSSVDEFVDARMTPDGLLMEPAASKRHFQSARCHVEFRTPFMPFARGQARGNNGFFCQGRYQVQILDSFGSENGKGECGALYGVAAPKVNVCFPPLSWQTFDVEFTAAVYEEGKKVKNARMTVHHNGVLVHQDVELPEVSAGALIKEEGPEPGPIFVQSHKAPLRFRNIWVKPY